MHKVKDGSVSQCRECHVYNMLKYKAYLYLYSMGCHERRYKPNFSLLNILSSVATFEGLLVSVKLDKCKVKYKYQCIIIVC